MENGKQSITPLSYSKFGEGKNDFHPLREGEQSVYATKFSGLTKREYFAGLAMQATDLEQYANTYGNKWAERVAADAVMMADALLEQLEKQKQ